MTTSLPVESPQSSQDIADWNRIAERYAAYDQYADPAQNPMYLHFKAVLWEALGDLNGCSVLDLGCGDGWFSGVLQQAGAQVCGVDGSDQLLTYARARHPTIEFVQADLAQGIPFAERQFERIVSLMVLMDLPDLGPLLRDVRQRLTATGRLIFTILHPGFFQYKIHFDEATQEWYRKVTNYFDPQVWRIESFGGHNHYHRNLTYYAELLRANGLAITRLYEPEWNPDPTHEQAHVTRRWPICLFVEARPLWTSD
jgi:SAM-dependent methyltransferase